jgi:hypothetical protein
MTFCLSTSFFEATTRRTLWLDMLGTIVFPQVEEAKVRVKDKHRWRVYEMAPKKIFAFEKVEVKRRWILFHNEEHHNV